MLLKEYRIKNKLSVADLANSLNVTRQHIYEIERCSAFSSRALALRIEEVTGGQIKAAELLFPQEATK